MGTLFVHQARHQLSPELDWVSHKKAEIWAAGHGGILWNRLTKNLGTHILLLHFLFLSHERASAISFQRSPSLIWWLLPLRPSWPSVMVLGQHAVLSVYFTKAAADGVLKIHVSMRIYQAAR